MNKREMQKAIIVLVIGLTGIVLCALVDWKIAVGVILIVFGNNLEKRWNL